MKFFLLLFILVLNVTFGGVETYFSRVGYREQGRKIANIDFVYLINLDHRVDRLEAALNQLSPFGIVPCRMPAVYGNLLSSEAFDEIGVKFSPGMKGGQWANRMEKGVWQHDFLTEKNYGKTFFARWTLPGAVGCYLSHLSVLQDAYDAGYETIWILEDDILFQGHTDLLGLLVERLNGLVDEWDVLYTDLDAGNKELYDAVNDFETDLKGHLWYLWRPDVESNDIEFCRKRTIISPDFIKIGARMRTHSMIVRRSGMEKILQFAKTRGLFLPYDHELTWVPGIQMYSLRYNLTSVSKSPSDIFPVEN